MFSAFSKTSKCFVKFTSIYSHPEIKKCQVQFEDHVRLSFPRFFHVTSTSQRRTSASAGRAFFQGERRSKNTDLPFPSEIENSVNVSSPRLESPKLPFVNPLVEKVSGTSDKLFKKIIASQKRRKLREKENVILLKGLDLIKAALSHHVQPQYVFYSKELLLNSLPSLELSPEKILQVNDRTIRDSFGCESSPGIVGVFFKPIINQVESSIPVTVLCTNIREPSNLGTIIAVAAATGCKSIVLSKGCADPWEQKVLSTAGGAHFHIPIVNNVEWDNITDFVPKDAVLYIADSSVDIDLDDSHIHTDIDYSDDSQDLSKMARIDFLKSNQNVVAERLTSNELEPQTQNEMNEEIQCHLFSAVSFLKKDIVICICGETEGVNHRIHQLGMQLKGHKLKIPLDNDMDSLNVSSALSVILFEIQRQFNKKRSAL